MSGHSKWSTIKRQKQATDQVRGQLFTKLATQIMIAVREGDSADPNSNFRLRLMIEKARSANMPKDNIDRAIARASSKGTDAANLSEVAYEGFGPHGVAVLAVGITDNKQRTSASVKNIFGEYGGNLGGVGSVAYLFERVGEIHVSKTKSADQVLDLAVAANSIDMEEDEDRFVIYTDTNNLHEIKSLLEKDLQVIDAEISYRPTTSITITERETAQKIIHLLSKLEEIDEIHKVYANADIPKEFIGAQ